MRLINCQLDIGQRLLPLELTRQFGRGQRLLFLNRLANGCPQLCLDNVSKQERLEEGIDALPNDPNFVLYLRALVSSVDTVQVKKLAVAMEEKGCTAMHKAEWKGIVSVLCFTETDSAGKRLKEFCPVPCNCTRGTLSCQSNSSTVHPS